MKWLLSLFSLLFLQALCSGQSTTYPDNMYPDSIHYPFIYGVASGDPTTHSVMLWTKAEEPVERVNATIELGWQIAEDAGFHTLVNAGLVTATVEHDFTALADAENLQPGKHYYYRFFTADSSFSCTGIAHTLPDTLVKNIKLAVVSCSSIWAGYFNAYRSIANRADIDFIVHLGDYVYDYPDERQLFRMPLDTPKDCASLSDWRQRHRYYLLDPDLRLARQNKTWIAEWDNHDIDVEKPGKQEEAIQAFYEYVPVRLPDKEHPEKIYRNFLFGHLAELSMIDMFIYRGKEEYAAGKKSVLGNEQDTWLKESLVQSKAQWHILGNQEMMTDWLSEGAPKFIRSKRGNGRVFDPGNWNGYPEDRQRLYDFIDSNHIQNVVVITGDIHMSFVMNMTGSPKDKTIYNRKTGEGAVGVEITGPSISRVNMKEAGVPAGFIPLVQRISRNLNPHHLWCQFSKHGYFTLSVSAEKCVAEFWYVPILKKTDSVTFGRGYEVLNGISHWQKKPLRRAISDK